MRKRFIPAEEVIHLNSASLVLVDHFKRCEALVHAKMDVKLDRRRSLPTTGASAFS